MGRRGGGGDAPLCVFVSPCIGGAPVPLCVCLCLRVSDKEKPHRRGGTYGARGRRESLSRVSNLFFLFALLDSLVLVAGCEVHTQQLSGVVLCKLVALHKYEQCKRVPVSIGEAL
jgi:hypothetical protein